MSCSEALRTQACFDGQLDALSAAAVERHVEGCAECQTLLQDLAQTREQVRRDLGHVRAPTDVRERILMGLAPAPKVRRALWRSSAFWIGVGSGIGCALASALVAVVLLAPWYEGLPLDALVTDHVDSLLPGHLTAVESTDRHTVKPWFAGRADVSPLVEDFAQEGYLLIGGRVDYLENQRAAVLVYRHGQHIINVFALRAQPVAPRHDTTRSGYHIACWRAGDLQYCAVSDAGWDELHGLARLVRERAARDASPQTPER